MSVLSSAVDEYLASLSKVALFCSFWRPRLMDANRH
jgi:hypothetical protein